MYMAFNPLRKVNILIPIKKKFGNRTLTEALLAIRIINAKILALGLLLNHQQTIPSWEIFKTSNRAAFEKREKGE